ncbi:MAG: hypothetical protein R3D55_25140 [Chloroflexota bacterium]
MWGYLFLPAVTVNVMLGFTLGGGGAVGDGGFGNGRLRGSGWASS